jgi:hypothetical protein
MEYPCPPKGSCRSAQGTAFRNLFNSSRLCAFLLTEQKHARQTCRDGPVATALFAGGAYAQTNEPEVAKAMLPGTRTAFGGIQTGGRECLRSQREGRRYKRRHPGPDRKGGERHSWCKGAFWAWASTMLLSQMTDLIGSDPRRCRPMIHPQGRRRMGIARRGQRPIAPHGQSRAQRQRPVVVPITGTPNHVVLSAKDQLKAVPEFKY